MAEHHDPMSAANGDPDRATLASWRIRASLPFQEPEGAGRAVHVSEAKDARRSGIGESSSPDLTREICRNHSPTALLTD